MVLIFTSLVTSDVEQLIMCMHCISSLKKCQFGSFLNFLIELFVFHSSIVEVLSIFWILISYYIYDLHSYYLGCLFTLLIEEFVQKFYILMKSSLSIFSFVACALLSQSRNHCEIQCHENFPRCFLLIVL